MARIQCKGCPWRVANDPKEIPNGPRGDAIELLGRWSSEKGLLSCPKYGMACHETPVGPEALPCVGWLAEELGPGNNIGLRIQARDDPRMHNWETIGDQRSLVELAEAFR